MFKLSRQESIVVFYLIGAVLLGSIIMLTRRPLFPPPEAEHLLSPRAISLEPGEMVPPEEGAVLDVLNLSYGPEHVYTTEELILAYGEMEEEKEQKEKKEVKAEAGKVNINTASQSQLESLPGIGPKKAEAIIAARPYSRIEEITRATGIGPKIYEALKDKITVDKETVSAPPAPTLVTPAKININTASQSQLESLPGIGPKRAEAIIAARPYSRIEEITRATGIGPKIYEGLKDLITVK